MVSICAKDSRGLYNYDVVTGLIKAAKDNDLKFAVDIYPYYGSDVDAALTAGYDIRHGLIGAGVYASVKDACRMIQTDKVYIPEGKDYSGVYENFVRYDSILNVKER